MRINFKKYILLVFVFLVALSISGCSIVDFIDVAHDIDNDTNNQVFSDDFEYTFENELNYLNENEIELTEDEIEVLKKLYEEAVLLDTDEAWEKYEKYLVSDLNLVLDGSEEDVITNIFAIYDIEDNKLIYNSDPYYYPEEQSPTALSKEQQDLHYMLWKHIVDIIPNEYLKYVKILEIGSDGVDNDLAYVVQLDNLSQWAMFLDTEDSLDENNRFTDDFNFTVIHEFGHVLTLNNTQIIQSGNTIGTYKTEEGMSKPNSYINKFYHVFWYNQNTSDDLAKDRYEENPENFVDDYAATNVEEDMAESFAFFVTKDKPSGDTLADRKIKFFYQFDELVKLRQDIRENIYNQ